MSDSGERVSGLVGPNTAISCSIGTVLTTRTFRAGEGWKTYRHLVAGANGDWLVMIPDPENPPED